MCVLLSVTTIRTCRPPPSSMQCTHMHTYAHMHAYTQTHTKHTHRFIQKQGLDRTFVECDNHMWRVDNRPLPPDVTVDGGSDWIAITRNYTHYLSTSRDPFLVGLKRYYEFSLLPAEVRPSSILSVWSSTPSNDGQNLL